jgi:hypothetical protein
LGTFLDRTEDVADGSADEALLRLVALSEHRVRLARARSAVDEHRRTPRLGNRRAHKWLTAASVNLFLRRLRTENAIKHSLLCSALLRRQELISTSGCLFADGNGTLARDLYDARFSWRNGSHANGDTDMATMRRSCKFTQYLASSFRYGCSTLAESTSHGRGEIRDKLGSLQL